MKTQFRMIGVILGLSLITACGGGSNSDDDEPTSGVFLDSPVAGITYRTQSIAGVTDATGTFSFIPGQTVTFSVGGITLPSVPAAAEVTPADIAGVAETEAAITGSPTATNILRFLQTLDEDGNADNGIVIDPAAITAATGETLNFSAATATFEDAFEDIFVGVTLIPVDQAIAHFVRQVIPLAGDWRRSQLTLGFNSLQVPNYGDTYWEEADLNIALDGSFSSDSRQSNGFTDFETDNQFDLSLLDETGQISEPDDPLFFAAIDAGKTVFGFADIDDDVDGGEGWGIAVRRSDVIDYALSDIAGTWRGFSLTIEDIEADQHIAYAQYAVASNGAYTSTEVTKYRNAPVENDSDSGLFTHAGNGDFAWNPTGGTDEDNGVMDAGKTVIAGVFSGDDGVNGDEEIALLIKQGSDYETSDLRGIWRLFALTAANQGANNYNMRGEMCIENDGSFTSTVSYSDGETGTDSGQFAISADGEFTWPGEDDFIGAMDAGKTVMGFVDLSDKTGDPNGLQIGVMIKTNFLPVTFSCP